MDELYKKSSALLKASMGNHLAVIKLLVDKYHADVNLPDHEVSLRFSVLGWSHAFLKENTPLFFAVTRRKLEAVEYLLSVGAKVNTQSGISLLTPLHVAVRQVDIPTPPPKYHQSN